MWPFVLILVVYLVKVITFLLLILTKRIRQEAAAGGPYTPTVDIILPMYNEERVIVDTIRNLLEIKYDRLSIIVVDDGSTDRSYQLVKRYFDGHPLITLLRQPNGGKSAALNHAIRISQGDIVVSIDADTWVQPDAIQHIVQDFRDKKVGAVAGHIKVGNRVNWLTEMQYFEYVAIWDNDRALCERVNGILIVPGALGAYRRSAVNAVAGFKTEMIAEDTELTLRILCNDYTIRNSAGAVAYTEAPDTLRMFFRQRVRWTTGLMQALVRDRRALCRQSHILAWGVLPFTWGFRVLFPMVLPLADYYFLYCFLWSGQHEALAWWASVVLTEAVTQLVILRRNREQIGLFKLLVLQRMYRHLLFCNYGFIFAKLLNGTLFSWGKIQRKGTISLESKVPDMSRP